MPWITASIQSRSQRRCRRRKGSVQSSAGMGARLDAGREVVLVFLFVAAVTMLVSRAPISVLSDYRHLILAALFLGTAVCMSERQPDGVARYGLSLGGLLERSDAGRPGL